MSKIDTIRRGDLDGYRQRVLEVLRAEFEAEGFDIGRKANISYSDDEFTIKITFSTLGGEERGLDSCFCGYSGLLLLPQMRV
jgi:hypothetical protein